MFVFDALYLESRKCIGKPVHFFLDAGPAARAGKQRTMAGSFPMFWLSPARLRGL
nr:MAG TPA: hypothetical protein [Caudoviricetes sp.]